MYQIIGNYIIRDWQMEDAASIAKYANNRKIWQNLRDGFPNPYTTHDAEIFITRISQADQRTSFKGDGK
jgi:RimJ/RimL family protein N-acetyltransferase